MKKKSVEKKLREEIASLHARISDLKQDREKFRNKFTEILKWWIELHGKNQNPNLAWLIQDEARFMQQTVEKWYW